MAHVGGGKDSEQGTHKCEMNSGEGNGKPLLDSKSKILYWISRILNRLEGLLPLLLLRTHHRALVFVTQTSTVTEAINVLPTVSVSYRGESRVAIATNFTEPQATRHDGW